ncbi:hypothetical protein COL32_27360 [Bacillus pseudomycoides]|nr:hypothetical protein CON70_15780 [Bacillus pseudomycoides]PFW87553.1 hypothetical protein COL29_29225 [Bacillus pseudomycoides]PFX37296.1 hypothetical protein COL32_27360 [Bacillus pseudomycoides]
MFLFDCTIIIQMKGRGRFVYRGELFLLGQKQENPPPQARVEGGVGSSIIWKKCCSNKVRHSYDDKIARYCIGT